MGAFYKRYANFLGSTYPGSVFEGGGGVWGVKDAIFAIYNHWMTAKGNYVSCRFH